MNEVVTLLALCITIAAPAAAEVRQPEEKSSERALGAIDVARIRELYHLTDALGDAIWPGFDIRKLPVAINNQNREELLVGHPDPPPEFRPFGDFMLNGRPVLIREGTTRHNPGSKGGAGRYGRTCTGWVDVRRPDQDTEDYLFIFLHECFHCFQKQYREPADGAYGAHPAADPVYSALLELESRILKAAIDEPDDQKARELVRMFVAVRRQRRADLPEHLVLLEGEEEYSEGTASYAAARMLQLLAAKGGIKPVSDRDPHYHGFRNARALYEQELAQILSAGDEPTLFGHAMYKHGLAQAFILDRLRPGWKAEMRDKGMTLFTVLERMLPPEQETAKHLAAAKKRFAYDRLLAEQSRRVNAYLAILRPMVVGPGRRYRVYFDEIIGKLRWKPRGRAYEVPEVLEKEAAAGRENAGTPEIPAHLEHRYVWPDGFVYWEMGGVHFTPEEVPVIWGNDYLEWIDPDPAPDRSDLVIEAERQENGVYHGLKLTTRGFSLKTAKARIQWSQEAVEIHPEPDPESAGSQP